jgi:CheY-like chemotaxis protein
VTELTRARRSAEVANRAKDEFLPQPAQSEAAWAPCRVLIVDDNEDAASVLADALGLLDDQVRCAADGPEGLDATRAFRPDVALVDIGLPVIDGYEVARRIRSEQAVAGTGWSRSPDTVSTTTPSARAPAGSMRTS